METWTYLGLHSHWLNEKFIMIKQHKWEHVGSEEMSFFMFIYGGDS